MKIDSEKLREASMTKLIDEQTLIDMGLLREYNGWKYKFNLKNNFFTANSKEDALKEASEAYWKLPPDERITQAERDEINYNAETERLVKLYAYLDLDELRDKVKANEWDMEKLNKRKFALPLEAWGTQRSARISAELNALAETNDAIKRVIKYHEEKPREA